jgi:hypothetical protein
MPDPYLQIRRLARLAVSSPRGKCERSHAIRSSSCQQAIATRSAYCGKAMSGSWGHRSISTHGHERSKKKSSTSDVGYRGKSGKHLLASISHFDPERSSAQGGVCTAAPIQNISSLSQGQLRPRAATVGASRGDLPPRQGQTESDHDEPSIARSPAVGSAGHRIPPKYPY